MNEKPKFEQQQAEENTQSRETHEKFRLSPFEWEDLEALTAEWEEQSAGEDDVRTTHL